MLLKSISGQIQIFFLIAQSKCQMGRERVIPFPQKGCYKAEQNCNPPPPLN